MPPDHASKRKKPRETRPWLVLTAILVASAGLSLVLLRALPLFAAAEAWVADLRIAHLAPPIPASDKIAVVAITEDTLATLPYRSPVDRGFLAQLLRTLEGRAVRAIGLDILIDQPTEPDKDALLRQTLADLSVPVVAAWADQALGVTGAQQVYMSDFLDESIRAYPTLIKDTVDGGVRRYQPTWRHAGGDIPSLAGALAASLGVAIPDDRFLIDYRRATDMGEGAFPVYPAHAAAVLPAEWFAGKVVLIGVDLPQTDRHRTPLSARTEIGEMAGVLIHAHALSQMLETRAAPRISHGFEWLLTLVMAALGLGIALLPRLGELAKIALGTGAVVLMWLGGFQLFAIGGPLVPLLAPTVSLVGAAGLGTAYAGGRYRAQRQYIRRAFEHFVAPQIVRRLEADPEQLKPGGERRDMTFVFTDITGFTALAESQPPATLVTLLNEYFDGMSQAVLGHGGTIDKFIGDAVVAFWGAPEDMPDHAAKAVACGLDMDRFAQGFVERWRSRGVVLGATRLGIHTGDATVGNFGGSERFDYTAVGDTVNTAARLESANKHLGTRVCVSGATAALCPEFTFRPIGDLLLKGKSQAVAAFEPLVPGTANGAVAAYRRAYDLLGGPTAEAVTAFEALAQDMPDDPLIRLHLARLRRGESGPEIVLEAK